MFEPKEELSARESTPTSPCWLDVALTPRTTESSERGRPLASDGESDWAEICSRDSTDCQDFRLADASWPSTPSTSGAATPSALSSSPSAWPATPSASLSGELKEMRLHDDDCRSTASTPDALSQRQFLHSFASVLKQPASPWGNGRSFAGVVQGGLPKEHEGMAQGGAAKDTAQPPADTVKEHVEPIGAAVKGRT